MPPRVKEFLFIDESGDPGREGNPIYILVGLHLSEESVHRVRQHMTAFRYHLDVVKELKDQHGAGKLVPRSLHLLEPLAEMTVADEISATATWLLKDKYTRNGGPYVGQGQLFRAFQIRLLLERHHARRPWQEDIDVVVDRWSMDEAQRRNLEDYLQNNVRLRPRISYVTTVDSSYADPIQIVDIYTRFVRRFVEGKASDAERALVERLVDIQEVERGLF